MNAPKEGWPVGMLCVVTDDHPDANLSGGIVRILKAAEAGRFEHEAVRTGICALGERVQHIEVIAVVGDFNQQGWEPCKYLRPLTDPDAETQGSDADVEAMA